MTLLQLARIVEIRTKIVSVSAFLIGTLHAVTATGRVDWMRAVVMALAVLAVDMATTGFNSFFDYWSGVDRLETNREADKVLVHQGVPPGVALIVSLTLYAVAIVLGLVLSFMVGPMVAVIGAVCMGIGFLYNGGPRPISSTPLGELFAGGFLGWALVVLSRYVQAGSVDNAAMLTGVPSLLMVASILTVNNTCDTVGDTQSGRRTLSIVVGPRLGEMLVYLQGFLAFLAVALLGVAGVLPQAALFTAAAAAAAAVPVYLRMHRRGYNHATKGPSMQSISKVFVLFSLAIIAPLGWAALQALR